MDAADTLVLRRVLGNDGRSRAFVNDQAVSVGLLKQFGDMLVEIQGQFEQRGLLDAATHRELLDAFAAKPQAVEAVRRSWADWQEARIAHETARAALEQARADEEWLRHALGELDRLKPEAGEEAALAERRVFLANRAQITDALASAAELVSGEHGAERGLNAAARQLERVREKAGDMLAPAIEALERAIIETTEATALIEAASRDGDGPDDLDAVEARLFELRTLARKHSTSVDALAALRDEVAEKLGGIEDGGAAVKQRAAAEAEARGRFISAAASLSEIRREAAARFDRAVSAELAPLKLERAKFATKLMSLNEPDWGAHGQERVAFEVATNPGAPPGPLSRVASGGELSRLLLALKVVLARVSTVPTLVFDEVDSGIGGAVAAAVGERLQRLGTELQVLVVTHSPQVAARGAEHWLVVKEQGSEQTATRIVQLTKTSRREEIARMLSGAQVTEEARAAAGKLLADAWPQAS
jgi:DNA repair protein RecN (Recombination protein N)